MSSDCVSSRLHLDSVRGGDGAIHRSVADLAIPILLARKWQTTL